MPATDSPRMPAPLLRKDDPALGGYVTIRRAMSVLGISRYRVMGMIARGHLQSEMMAEKPLITIDSVNRVLEARRAAATVAADGEAATTPTEA